MFKHLKITAINGQRYYHITTKPCHNLKDRVIPRYEKQGKLFNLSWPTRNSLQNIYITKKPWDSRVRHSMLEVIKYISGKYPHINIMVQDETAEELNHEILNNGLKLDSNIEIYTGDIKDIRFKTDLLVTLGGDGTILRAVSQFLNFNVPPILSFSMGTLGFLLPFDFEQHKSIIDNVVNNKVQVLKRLRLECHLVNNSFNSNSRANKDGELSKVHALNEISLHRGSNPNLISLDIFVDNEFLTTTTADGIIMSTPTGSTAYSLSSGGPIIHPSIKGIMLTPICPRSLSFRPLILPSNSDVMIKLNQRLRNISVQVQVDGLEMKDFKNGDEIHIRKQLDIDNNIWCIARSENDWTKDINDLLGFNKSFKVQIRG